MKRSGLEHGVQSNVRACPVEPVTMRNARDRTGPARYIQSISHGDSGAPADPRPSHGGLS